MKSFLASSEDKEDCKLFVWSLLFSAIVFLPYLTLPLYSIDDYFLFQLGDISTTTLWFNFYSTGRPLEGLLADVFSLMGAQPLTKPLGPVLLLSSLSLFGIITCRLLQVSGFWMRLGFILIVICNPFYSELFYFSIVPSYSAIAIFFLVTGLWSGEQIQGRQSALPIIVSVGSYVASLCIYQIFLPMVFMVFIVRLGLAVAKPSEDRHRSTMLAFKMLLPLGGAFIIYSFCLKIAFHFWPPDLPYPGTGLFQLLNNLISRGYWEILFVNFKSFLLTSNSFNAVAINFLVWIVFGFSCLFGIVRTRKPGVFFIGALLFAIATFSTFGFALLRPEAISGRNFTAFGIYRAALLLLSINIIGASTSKFFLVTRRFLIGVSLFALTSQVGLVGKSVLQVRMNASDRSLATRIAGRIEQKRWYFPNATLVILGVPSFGAIDRSRIGDFNVSALGQYSRVMAVNEYAGLTLKQPNAAELEIARKVARSAKKWPDPRSVMFEQGIIVVKLSEY